MFKNLMCIDLISPVEPTPSNNTFNSDEIIFFIVCIVILLAVALLIGLPAYFLSKKNKKQQKLLNSLEQKHKPVAFTNQANNDITIIAPGNYTEIEIQFKLYNQSNEIIKQYSIKEFSFTQNEQRVIANLKDFNAYKISYSIINYK